jgi:hypothetical protein
VEAIALGSPVLAEVEELSGWALLRKGKPQSCPLS